jgi:hypothetical protein
MIRVSWGRGAGRISLSWRGYALHVLPYQSFRCWGYRVVRVKVLRAPEFGLGPFLLLCLPYRPMDPDSAQGREAL